MGQVVWIGFIVASWITFISNIKTLDANAFFGIGFSILVITVPTILWYSRHAIGRKVRDSSATSSIKQVAATNETEWGAINRKNQEERATQLRALQDAVPHAPPHRMRATIRYNALKIPVFETRYFEGLSAEQQIGTEVRYSLDMILELSEEERGIVLQNELHMIVLDEKPLYSKDDLENMRRAGEKRAESRGGRGELDLVVKEIAKQSGSFEASVAEVYREQTRVGDFFNAPFCKTFPSPHEARQYGDELTNKILPGIRKLIDSYRNHSDQPATMEF